MCEYIVVVMTFMELSISGDRSVAMRVEPAMGLLLGGPAVLDIVSAGACGSVSLTHYYALVVLLPAPAAAVWHFMSCIVYMCKVYLFFFFFYWGICCSSTCIYGWWRAYNIQQETANEIN